IPSHSIRNQPSCPSPAKWIKHCPSFWTRCTNKRFSKSRWHHCKVGFTEWLRGNVESDVFFTVGNGAMRRFEAIIKDIGIAKRSLPAPLFLCHLVPPVIEAVMAATVPALFINFSHRLHRAIGFSPAVCSC